MDKVQQLHRGFPGSFDIHTPLKLSMTIKDTIYSNHGDFINSSRTNELWTGVQQNEPSSTPGDLVSLAWLQKGDIIQIAPLDGEEDHQTCFENSTASVSSGKSDDFLPIRQTGNLDEPSDFPSIPTRSTTHSDPHVSNATSIVAIQRPASADIERYSSPCIADPHLVNTHQISLNGQGLSKPNYSYTHLIFMAIESTPQKCMTVNQIYNWCETNFPFYKQAGAGWKNSLRHNLSINKSFKRLPRDSRPGDCVIVQCRKLSFFCPRINELEESEDDEGPGRGAFWTVEPRERPTLMDAIKRNPWNFANMAALVSGQCDQNAAYNMFGMRRFGLTQSAPGQVLRAAGIGNTDVLETNSDAQSGTIHLSPGGVRLVPTLDGRFVAARDCRLAPIDVCPPSSDGSLNGTSQSASLVLPDSRYWLSPEINSSDAGAGIDVEWSAEDEEKYARTLQLLMESGDCGSQSNPNALTSDGADGKKLQNNEGMFLTDEIKLCTKQRRKSRLQPTRVGKCNECKENAEAGCESCLAKRRRFLADSLSTHSLNDRTFVDVANSLDSDQECGPAGGPTVRRQNPTHPADSEIETKKDDIETNEAPEETADEVYVTPAPYIDHEYSHCHAQLRRPEEIRLVNNFNELYCAEALKRMSKGRSLSKQGRMLLSAYDESEVEYDEAADDAFSSQDQTTYSDDCTDVSEGFPSDEASGTNGYRKRRRTLQGSHRTLGPHLVDNTSRSRESTRRRLGTHGSRARGKRKFGVCHSSSVAGGTRRSKRVIRAPKRPYDDFEDPFLIEGEEIGGFVSKAAEKMDGIYAMGVQADATAPSHSETISNHESAKSDAVHARLVRGRRGRRRGRKRGGRSNILYAHKNVLSNHPSEASDQLDSTSEEDEELNYLRIARRRQRMKDSIEQDDICSAASSGSPNYHTSLEERGKRVSNMPYNVASKCHSPRANGSRAVPLGMSAVWGQSRWAIAQKFSAQSWPHSAQVDSEQEDMLEESASGLEVNAEDLEECEEIRQVEPSKSGERTTVEAAQLLLGISQMQSFRRQSGYLSLDSSGTSTSLTIDASDSAKDTARELEAHPRSESLLDPQNNSHNFQCSSPSK